MIIAIPVDDKDINSDVCISYGRTPYFMFYDTEKKTAEYFDNGAISTQGGAGIKASQKVVDMKADVVITLHCGENAAEVLKAADIKIIKGVSGKAMDNIKAYNDGELSELTDIHPGYHHQGN